MRTYAKRSILVLLLYFIVSIIINNDRVISADVNRDFNDVSRNHWAHNSIEWAVKNNVINGYPDQTFRPDNKITEAEFIKLVVNSFSNLALVTKQNKWYDPYYRLLQHTAWKVPQEIFEYMVDAEKPIKRGTAAQVMAATQGYYYNEELAIQFLIDNNITKGKTSPTIQGYERDSFLTRAEAVEFIYNFTINRPFEEIQYLELEIEKSPFIPMYEMEKELVNYFENDEDFSFGFSLVYAGSGVEYVFHGKDGILLDISRDLDKIYIAEFIYITVWKSETKDAIDYNKYYANLFELANILTNNDLIIPDISIKNSDKFNGVDTLSPTYYKINNRNDIQFAVTESKKSFVLEIQHNLYKMPEYRDVELDLTPFEEMGYRLPSSISFST